MTPGLALFLEGLVRFVSEWITKIVGRIGVVRAVGVAGLLGISAIIGCMGFELLVRRFDPQEVSGWGERPSLMPDAQFGWRLKPSQMTHLRWESYDYFVTSNSLGFPGPEYPAAKPSNTFRIMVTGDAFSSAEGVDTDQSWPHLLETDLSLKTSRKKIEVLNFAVTGYGPNQYASVIRHFAPIYKPDLILVEMFVNDFQDVTYSNESFQQRIGFGEPDQESLYSIIRI